VGGGGKKPGLEADPIPQHLKIYNFSLKNNAFLACLDLKFSLKTKFWIIENTLIIALMDQWLGKWRIALKMINIYIRQ